MDTKLIMQTAARVIALFVAIPLHEASHAFVASKLGDPTAKYAGRLTLNPFKHFDLMGSLCLLVAGIGWAKPVPVDPRYFKNKRGGMALTAAAGPLSNLIMAFLTMVIYKTIFYTLGRSSSILFVIEFILSYVIVINISLFIFNLLPAPPFDGGRIFTFFLPEKIYFEVMRYEQYIYIAILILVMTGVLSGPLYAANRFIFNLLDGATSFIDKIAAAAFYTAV